jgi:uncharacterized protein YfaS (alpha-2-macroglobulin family)
LRDWEGSATLEGEVLGDTNVVVLEMEGKGRLYFTATLRYCKQEEPIVPRNDGLKVTRKYTRLVYSRKGSNDWSVKRVPFTGTLASGDEVEVTLTVTTGGNREHLLLEDCFPSGMEYLKKPDPWYNTWCGWWSRRYTHKEARDDRMVFFLDNLYMGSTTFNYLLRAETPGLFHGLPARAELMYDPEVSGNSGETMVRISDGR